MSNTGNIKQEKRSKDKVKALKLYITGKISVSSKNLKSWIQERN